MTFDEWTKLPEDDIMVSDVAVVDKLASERIKGYIIQDPQIQAKINNYLLFLVSACSIKRNMELLTPTISFGNHLIDSLPDNSPAQTFAVGVLSVGCTVANVLSVAEKKDVH